MPYVTSELTAAPARSDGRGVGGGLPRGEGAQGWAAEGAAAGPGAWGRWASARGLLWLEGAGRGGERASPGCCGQAWGAGCGQICLLPQQSDANRVLTSEQGLFEVTRDPLGSSSGSPGGVGTGRPLHLPGPLSQAAAALGTAPPFSLPARAPHSPCKLPPFWDGASPHLLCDRPKPQSQSWRTDLRLGAGWLQVGCGCC